MELLTKFKFAFICFGLIIISCSDKNRSIQINNYEPKIATPDSNPYILGGFLTEEGSVFESHTVGVINVSLNNLCTGVIVADRFILTAAHCIEGNLDDIYVTFGTSISRDSIAIQAKTAFISKRYSELKKFNRDDVAIVEIASNIPDGFEPVRILQDSSILEVGTHLFLAGFGDNQLNQEKSHPGRLRATEVAVTDPDYTETEFLVDQSEGLGVCHGDSGGPAYINLRGKLYLVGITSRGNDECEFSVFTNTVFINQFLDSVF